MTNPREDPLPVALGLATSWKSIVLAHAPVPAVRMAVKIEEPWDGKGKKPQPKGKQREAFVDVVAAGGAEWVRIYSKKTSQLLAEFREADSYLTSDYESDSEGAPSWSSNSITRLVAELLALAEQVERIPGAAPPKLTLRLSRIEEFPEGGHPDPRIPATFAAVRGRGVNLVFGDLSEIPFSELPVHALPSRPVRTTRRVNLDPTALMGLCSDLLHYPLPATEDEAVARFYRPDEVVGSTGQSQNSRELVRALLEEMSDPLVEQIRDALAEVLADGEEVEFWATRQAITYLQQTISSEETVGEGNEQRRMRRLTGLEAGDFWEGSRYASSAGVLQNMRLHVFNEPETYPLDVRVQAVSLNGNGKHDGHNGHNGHNGHGNGHLAGNGHSPQEPCLVPDHTLLPQPLCRKGMTSFHDSTSTVCSAFLSEYAAHLASPASSSAAALPSFLTPRRLPSPRVAQITTPFTVVALHSLARGAQEGMTTLSMGHVVFRELYGQPRWRVKGWVQSNYALEEADGTSTPNAVAWILPYRSLGESKRIKFSQGDYSFPTFVQRVLKRDENGSSTRSPSPA